jgi:transglutaminase-like putative cysteine protease
VNDPQYYLRPGKFTDSDNAGVIEFARDRVGDAETDLDKTLRLFYAVRDEIRYDPYIAFGDPACYQASIALKRKRGWCVAKSALFVAALRSSGIPARPGYADVKNHLATPRLLEAIGTDIFYWHSYAEVLLGGRWVKATPVFNKTLCDRFGLKALDFDGEHDSLFHEFDRAGNRHMEYIQDRGAFADVPFDDIVATLRSECRPGLLDGIEGDFQAEAGR